MFRAGHGFKECSARRPLVQPKPLALRYALKMSLVGNVGDWNSFLKATQSHVYNIKVSQNFVIIMIFFQNHL